LGGASSEDLEDVVVGTFRATVSEPEGHHPVQVEVVLGGRLEGGHDAEVVGVGSTASRPSRARTWMASNGTAQGSYTVRLTLPE